MLEYKLYTEPNYPRPKNIMKLAGCRKSKEGTKAKYLDELALMGLKVCVENPLVLASFCGENTERLSRLGNFF